MKIWNILDIPLIREPVKYTEFAYEEKFINPNSMIMRVEAKYPYQKPWPLHHPDLNKNPASDRNYKFLFELRQFDHEFLLHAYRNAIATDTEKRINDRTNVHGNSQKKADMEAIQREQEAQAYTIMRRWIERFHMEKIFEHLKIKTMDEFKHFIHVLNERTDVHKEYMHEMYRRQGGTDPSVITSPQQWDRLTGKNEELIRFKIDLERKDLLKIDQMQHRIAEQFATLALNQLQQMSNTGFNPEISARAAVKKIA